MPVFPHSLVVGAAIAGLSLLVVSPASAKCTRMGFTVNDYGKEGPTNDAKALLDKHIANWASGKGITNYSTGKKDVKCELFLDVILFDEHTCTASATVCWDGEVAPGAGGAEAAAPANADQPARKTKAAAKPAADTEATAAPAKKTAAKKAAAAETPPAEAQVTVVPARARQIEPAGSDAPAAAAAAEPVDSSIGAQLSTTAAKANANLETGAATSAKAKPDVKRSANSIARPERKKPVAAAPLTTGTIESVVEPVTPATP